MRRLGCLVESIAWCKRLKVWVPGVPRFRISGESRYDVTEMSMMETEREYHALFTRSVNDFYEPRERYHATFS